METVEHHTHRLVRRRRFKIDLIVWKLPQVGEDFKYCLEFKIDLIVWKLQQIEYFCNKRDKFKIDLIVWKLIFFCVL